MKLFLRGNPTPSSPDYGHLAEQAPKKTKMIGWKDHIPSIGRIILRGKYHQVKKMNPTKAYGQYDTLPNGCPTDSIPFRDESRLWIYLDESSEPSMYPGFTRPYFGIAGFITNDPQYVDACGSSLPESILFGDEDERKKTLEAARERNYEPESWADVPYKYSTLAMLRPDELNDVLGRMNDVLGDSYFAKVIRKNPKKEFTIKGTAKISTSNGSEYMEVEVRNPDYPDPHDVYASVLEDLLTDITDLYPDTMFLLYLDPNTTMDKYRLEKVCWGFPTVMPIDATSVQKSGGLRFADLIVGAVMEPTKGEKGYGFAYDRVMAHIINKNAVHRSESHCANTPYLTATEPVVFGYLTISLAIFDHIDKD